MNATLNTEQLALRDSVIRFCQQELNGQVNERDRAGSFSKELWKKCALQKLTALPVDKDFGGAGLDSVSTMVALEAFGYGCEDGGLSFSVAAHLLATVVPLWKYGSEAQRGLLRDLCDGTKIGANAITEAQNGSDVFDMHTKAVESNCVYTINGCKTYITNGSVADVILLYAVTDEEKGFFGGITLFLIASGTSGFAVSKNLEKMGLSTCQMSELVFDGLKTGHESILGKAGSGGIIFQHSMEWERLGMSALHTGIMQRLVEQVIAFSRSRMIQGEPLSRKQVIAHRIADMKVRLEASRALVYRAAAGLDNNRDNAMHSSIAKLFTSEAFVKTAAECQQIYGASGYLRETGIERIVRDSLASTLYSGTSEIQKNMIGRLLGL